MGGFELDFSLSLLDKCNLCYECLADRSIYVLDIQGSRFSSQTVMFVITDIEVNTGFLQRFFFLLCTYHII